MINFTKLFFLFFLISFVNNIYGQVELPKIVFEQVFSELSSPVSLADCNDDRIFIVEKSGLVKIGYPNGEIRSTPFLDIRERVKSGGERGLLGLAFPADFKQSGLFYVNYTGQADGETVISRFRISSDSNVAVYALEEKLLEIDQPFSNHNGGNLEFGKDGYLYIGMGDGGSGGDPQNQSQNKQTLLGKMLRIDVNHTQGYTIPTDNPYVGNTEYRPEIWAMGLRNPWRYKFDERNGDLWIADVGQGKWEEIDFEAFGSGGGKNYGWRCYEGYDPYNTAGCLDESYYTFPVAAFNHNEGHCSITGGVVDVKDPSSSLFGHYISADYCSGQFWGTKKNDDGSFSTIKLARPSFSNFVAFGYDLERNIYVASDNGNIYRIDTFLLCAPDLKITGTDDHIGCGTDSVILSVNNFPNGTYTWFLDGDAIAGSNSDTLYAMSDGNYTVQFLSDSCSSVSLKPYTLIQNEDLEVTLSGLPVEYCINGAPITLKGQPEGGIFIGTGVVDSVFYPEVSNVGTFTITYFYEDVEGCNGFDVKVIKVLREPETHITVHPPNQCLQGPPFELTATPAEGFFTGNGVSGNTFYPSVSGVGIHKILYTYNPVPGCFAYDSIYITVKDCSINILDIEKSQYSIYPNPVSEELVISWEKNDLLPGKLIILDQLGRIVFEEKSIRNKSESNKFMIKMNKMAPGSYMIMLNDEQNQYIKKVIKL